MYIIVKLLYIHNYIPVVRKEDKYIDLNKNMHCRVPTIKGLAFNQINFGTADKFLQIDLCT